MDAYSKDDTISGLVKKEEEVNVDMKEDTINCPYGKDCLDYSAIDHRVTLIKYGVNPITGIPNTTDYADDMQSNTTDALNEILRTDKIYESRMQDEIDRMFSYRARYLFANLIASTNIKLRDSVREIVGTDYKTAVPNMLDRGIINNELFITDMLITPDTYTIFPLPVLLTHDLGVLIEEYYAILTRLDEDMLMLNRSGTYDKLRLMISKEFVIFTANVETIVYALYKEKNKDA